MKVLLINGSPHKAGNTATALAEVAKTLEAEGIGTDLFWLETKPVRGCLSCYYCLKNNLGKCVFDDDICNRLLEHCAEADAFVVGSPTYYGQPAGALLAVLQRACFAGRKYIEGKPAACVAVCRRGGSTAAFQCLNMPFEMLNSLLVGSQYWNIAFGREEGEAAQDSEGMQTMRTMARNLAWLLKNLHREGAEPRPDREPWQPMHFIR